MGFLERRGRGAPTHVLVTGGAGYLDSILCERLLDAGCRVTALDNLMYGQHTLFHLCANPSFSFVFDDARDESLIRKQITSVDVIIPLAAVVGAPACDRDPVLAESVNLGAVRLLMRLRSPDQLLVFPTTNSGYGTKSGETYCCSTSPLGAGTQEILSSVVRTARLRDLDPRRVLVELLRAPKPIVSQRSPQCTRLTSSDRSLEH